MDQYALLTYHPSQDVVQIEGRLELTGKAKAIFARAHPQIDDKATFNRDCQTSGGELELGCYSGGHIYVLRIDNADLAPEMDVVMAHELLHAAYVRLKTGEKIKLNNELDVAFKGIPDKDLQTRMADYAKSEPGEQDNELHSILGTEYPGLSPFLEQYYQQYFLDRSVILAAQARYEAVFNSRKHVLDGELNTIKAFKSQLVALNQRMEYLKARGSIAAYNTLVPQQNQLVDDINTRIRAYGAAVDEYNALSRSLDSQQITAPAESTVQ